MADNDKVMKIKSTVFNLGEKIPAEYTCDGMGVNPPLEISDVPLETKSLALIVNDPDVPRNVRPDGNYNHWVVWNIKPDIREIPENWKPDAIVGVATSQTNKYIAPCPPSGTHRYYFTLYALDTLLDLDEEAGREELEAGMEGHVLEKAETFGIVSRQI